MLPIELLWVQLDECVAIRKDGILRHDRIVDYRNAKFGGGLVIRFAKPEHNRKAECSGEVSDLLAVIVH